MTEVSNIIHEVQLKDDVWYTVLAYSPEQGWVIGDPEEDLRDGYKNLRIIGVGDMKYARVKR